MTDPSVHGHDEHHDDDGIPHVSVKEYLTGFVLSVVLTAIPFALVMGKAVPNSIVLAVVLLAFAAVQVVVHMVYFLHMNAKSEGGWNALALIFTVVLVVIVLSGSLWVMHHLNSNMMPGAHDMQEMIKNAP
ncbi:cytochrome o ubiquinol oxidase subunit IV [Lysobacter silvisoli]|uniref:Cytochrome bo(3) ubiquinol oxidase subunit 4 n=1 Tax=Lysobacter silvisoli TaxID=2293254 RepID=A0A371K501_9GAMM|nr:cytochrome o ubiquinol oxidase subunit IV [Lysobacter silvisoli]RDZ28934.1 cytochrome o ubiquinol oxidase subunit IV [Lysobacter silvisoli]